MKKRKDKKIKRSDREFNLFNIIEKMQDMYKKLYDGIYERFDLKNDINQGKIFTIILVFLFILVGIITIFILFNSLIGINLIYSLFKYTFIFVKEFYKIIKTKGKLILKYLHAKFDTNYQKEKEMEPKSIELQDNTLNNSVSLYNEYVLDFIDYLTKSIDYLDVSNIDKLEVIKKMQEVTLDLSFKERENTTKKLEDIMDYLLKNLDLEDKKNREASLLLDLDSETELKEKINSL